MRRILAFLLIGMMGVGIFAGCAKVQPEEKKPEETVVTQPVENPEAPAPGETPGKELKKVEGIYIGQIDGNSIEVQVDGEPMVFRMVDIGKVVDGLKDKEKVRIVYEENEHGQLLITKFEKIN